ncbi:MAG: sulfurtransferase [Halobacteriota archaeon]|uniref:sulfurtransferase n=1 Tax=Natronomonas sp. TaxID=2184060 RepID=UPI0039750924
MNDRVVGVEWLAERLETEGVAVVDVRDAWEYDGIGHVPGAVNVPFDTFRADEHGAAEAGMLPGAGVFAELMGSAGIAPDDDVVAYDDTHGVFAARLLVTAELYGHDPHRLHLLDGDYSVWNRSEPTATDVPEGEPVEYPAKFRADGPLIERETVEAAVDDPETVVVDTREPHEYEEGHIPGAVRLDWRELVDTDARTIRPEPALRDLLEERGIVPGKRIILYCNTARRISHTYTVLRALGYSDLSFYEGSLTEWEREGGALETDD